MILKPCLVCSRSTFLTRGCCQKHYNRHRFRVGKGVETWARLEAAGRAAPPRRPEKGAKSA